MTLDPLLDIVHPQVSRYIDALGSEHDPLVIRMAKFAREQQFPWLGLDAAKWLELLTRMVNGKRAFEFGSGFGYSAYFLARAAGEGGEVHGSDVDARMLLAHEKLFAGHPYKSRITLHQGDGVEILASLPGTFDVVFIDLDKPYYPAALEAAIPRVRPGGLILADNVLWSGRTTAPARPGDANVAALRRFNELAHDDSRLRTAIMPAGDGLSVSLRV
jgi:caffeoyl-CoA O-methyltransferase